MDRTGAHHAFDVEIFLKTDESVIATQGAFRDQFILHQNDAVPDRELTLLWVESSI